MDTITTFPVCQNAGVAFTRERNEVIYFPDDDTVARKKYTNVTLEGTSSDGRQGYWFHAYPDQWRGWENPKRFAAFESMVCVYPIALKDQSSSWTCFQFHLDNTGTITRVYRENNNGGYADKYLSLTGTVAASAQHAIEIGKGLVTYSDSDLSCEQPVNDYLKNLVNLFVTTEMFTLPPTQANNSP